MAADFARNEMLPNMEKWDKEASFCNGVTGELEI
jgi:hypothetical protein